MTNRITLELLNKEEVGIKEELNFLNIRITELNESIEAIRVLKKNYLGVNTKSEPTLILGDCSKDIINSIDSDKKRGKSSRELPKIGEEYSTNLLKKHKVYWVILNKGEATYGDIVNHLLKYEPNMDGGQGKTINVNVRAITKELRTQNLIGTKKDGITSIHYIKKTA